MTVPPMIAITPAAPTTPPAMTPALLWELLLLSFVSSLADDVGFPEFYDISNEEGSYRDFDHEFAYRRRGGDTPYGDTVGGDIWGLTGTV